MGGVQRACVYGAFRAFTLVELLVVIVMISVLAALLLPTVEASIFQSRVTSCANNHKQLYFGCALYSQDNGGFLPDYAQYGNHLADPYCKSVNTGRLLRTGYVGPESYLEPDVENWAPTGDDKALAYNGEVRWQWLAPNPVNPPIYFMRNHVIGFYSIFLLDNPWNTGFKNRRLDVANRWKLPLMFCRIDAATGIKTRSHARRFSNCTYEDGHVRTLAGIEARAAAYPTGDTQNQTIADSGWWAWARDEDARR